MQFDESQKETTTATPIFPARIHDAKAAVRWLRANAKQCHVDPNRMGMMGGSAHLALLVGPTDPSANLEGDCADDPPVLTLHGDQDVLVPVEQAREFDEKMKAVGASHTLMVFEGQGHGFSAEYQKRAENAACDFFDKHLKK